MIFFSMLNFSANVNAQTVNNTPYKAPMNNQYALVYFFDSSCGHCHKFSPVLKQFASLVGLPVYDFSIDGRPIPGFPTPIPSTPEIATAFFENPRSIIVPATFFINVNNHKYVRVSRGEASLQDLQRTYNNIINDPVVMEALQ